MITEHEKDTILICYINIKLSLANLRNEDTLDIIKDNYLSYILMKYICEKIDSSQIKDVGLLNKLNFVLDNIDTILNRFTRKQLMEG